MEPDDGSVTTCPECGALNVQPERDCRERFRTLLALDHSRREPWGALHGVAFAAFALQHPSAHERATMVRAWIALWRVVRRGDDPVRLFTALRRKPSLVTEEWSVPPLPPIPPPGGPYRVTIVDLGDFDAGTYAERALDWARAVVEHWEDPTDERREDEESDLAGGHGRRSE